VLLVDVEAAETGLAERLDVPVADPPLLLDLAVIHLRADLARRRVQRPDPVLLLGPWLRPREHHLLMDLAEEQRLGKRGNGALGLALGLGLGGGFHAVNLA